MREVLAIILLVLGAQAAAAQSGGDAAPAVDGAILDGCLADARQQMDVGVPSGFVAHCVGEAASRCIETLAVPGDADMAGCFYAEASWWDARLNDAYQDLMGRMKDLRARDGGGSTPHVERLVGMERAWIAWRDRLCDFAELENPGGTAARLAHSGCFLEETARQALRLMQETRKLDNP